MPVKHSCTKCRKACKKNVREGDESICCDKCKKWVHFRCTGLSPEELNLFISTDNLFTCDRCRNTCSNCKKLCRINQKVHTCKTCKQKIHEKCKTDDFGGFLIDPSNDMVATVRKNMKNLKNMKNSGKVRKLRF